MTPRPGDKLTPWNLDSVSAGDMKIWADILADPNPIHLDPGVSRALGFGGKTVNQGPANLSYVINMLEMNFPNAVIDRVETKFLGNVFSGDRVTVEGNVIIVEESETVLKLTCDAILKTNNEMVALSVRATLSEPTATGQAA